MALIIVIRLTTPDVFLSPLKPPTKASISIEAIQSSLYYFHVDTEEDNQVKQSITQQHHSDDGHQQSVPVTRKPLATSSLAHHPLPSLPEGTFRQTRDQDFHNNGLESDGQLRLDTSVGGGSRRKPVASTTASGLHQASSDYAVSPANTQPPPYDERDHVGLTGTYRPNYETSEPDTSSMHGQRSTSITIIRRDIASNSQWNIGSMTVTDSTFSGSNIKPVRVELSTPGYGRFTRGVGYETPRPGSAGSTAASIKRAMQDATLSPSSATSPATPGMPFTRVVDFRRMAMSDLRRTVFQRTNSMESTGRPDGKSGIEKNVLAFDSPWHGTCCFVNAIDGKSLKIKHTISSNSSTLEGTTVNVGELRFNLGWSVLSNVKDARIKRKEAEPDTLPIPELMKSRKENFRKSFQNFRNKSRESFQRLKQDKSEDYLRDISNIETPTTNNLADQQSSQFAEAPFESNENEEQRISLKLGRERAGGGFRGHSAKLGKLIIEDEGLKMCDLVVAAAMGVWWQHYDG